MTHRLAFAIAVVGLALGGCAPTQPSQRDASVPLRLEDQVDLQRYAGLWYEIARYPNRFEQGCEGVTAEYLLRPEGGLSVINTCHRPGRETQRARGRARVVEGSGGARLQVSFAPAWIPFAWGDYWILEVSDGYETALVGTPSGGYLWILARTPSVSAEERGRLEAIARVNGFDPTRLETVSHPADRGGE